MGKYSVNITSDAREDLRKIHKSGNKATIKKIEVIFRELSENPRQGSGQPEQLKFTDGIWSRRLDKKNRLRYTIHEDVVTVFVLSALGHYSDK